MEVDGADRTDGLDKVAKDSVAEDPGRIDTKNISWKDVKEGTKPGTVAEAPIAKDSVKVETEDRDRENIEEDPKLDITAKDLDRADIEDWSREDIK